MSDSLSKRIEWYEFFIRNGAALDQHQLEAFKAERDKLINPTKARGHQFGPRNAPEPSRGKGMSFARR